jgi:UPF0755 protein
VTDRFQPRGRGSVPRRDPAQLGAQLRARRVTPESRERAAQTLERSMAAHDARTAQGRARNRGRSRRRAIVLATIVSLVLVALVALPTLGGHLFRAVADANPDLIRIGPIADAVGATIGDRPDQPAGTDPTVVDFRIEPGMGAGEITQALVERELVTDRVAFTWVLVSGGALDELQAGTHQLNRTMTPRQVASALAGEPIVSGGVPVVLREGLRLEQIAAYLQTLPLENFDAQQFYDLATNPPQSVRDDFTWLSVLPEGRSVEGFLGPGVFDVDSAIDAPGMLDLLLTRWQNSPSFDLIAQAQSDGKDFYKALVLASIVERETDLDEEKPLIAGVYQNRLDGLLGPTLLNADPTIIYAKDTMLLRETHVSEWPEYAFWTLDNMNSPGSFQVAPDLVDYQTYHNRGLPPGPICTPSTTSLAAALSPDTADGYLFFVAKGDGSNSHAFAKTYEEHQQNIDFYWRGVTSPTPDLPTAVPAP